MSRKVFVLIAVALFGMVAISSSLYKNPPKDTIRVMREATLDMADSWFDVSNDFAEYMDSINTLLQNSKNDFEYYENIQFILDNRMLQTYGTKFYSYNKTGLPELLKEASRHYAESADFMYKHLKAVMKNNSKAGQYLEDSIQQFNIGSDYQLEYLNGEVY